VSFRPRTRSRLLGGAVLSAVVVVALTVLVLAYVPTLDHVDNRLGRWPESWTFSHHGVVRALLVVEAMFGTLAMTVYTAVTAGLLALRRHFRAALWTIGVMLVTALTTTAIKMSMQRKRPVWTDPVQVLHSFSFPSGHASGIASGAGVAIVLAAMFVRRRSLRRLVDTAALVLVVVVGLDRVFLGVHNPSDVVAGYAVGAFWVCVATLVFDPAPRARPRPESAPQEPSDHVAAVVVNPSKFEDVAAFKEMVEHTARDAGWTVNGWHETTIEDPGRSMAEAAALSGADLVLVAGGDGTVRTVCAELAGTGVPVGVVPAGTGNLLARNLGIPLYLQAAVETALHVRDRAIDLVRISGDGIGDDEHFMVMAGMGFDAAIMEGANEQIKAHVGWLAYVVSALRNLMFPAVRIEISVDDGPWSKHRARTVVVGNVGYLQAGMPLLPDAAIDDGVLDVVILHPRRFLSWIPLAFRVLSKGKRLDEMLDRRTGRKVSIRAAAATPRQVDGDPIGAGRELDAECVHGRLLVRVPR
jgi:YegS/Rv2252/BmrU family lipid kinase